MNMLFMILWEPNGSGKDVVVKSIHNAYTGLILVHPSLV